MLRNYKFKTGNNISIREQISTEGISILLDLTKKVFKRTFPERQYIDSRAVEVWFEKFVDMRVLDVRRMAIINEVIVKLKESIRSAMFRRMDSHVSEYVGIHFPNY